jgi:hypothetical protein
MSVATDVDLIRRMLDEGRLAQVDEGGHLREPYATCSRDGASGPVYRVTRAGRKVTEVIFRCPMCGEDFTATPEAMHLR